MSEAHKPTTPEDVANAVGALIVDMTDNGWNNGELAIILAAYTKLLEVMPKPAPVIRKEEVQ